MPFTARTRTQIRDAMLADFEARYAAAGTPLLIEEGSHHYRLAEVLALILETLEAQAEALSKEILPDQATSAFLDRHGDVEGMARDPAVATVLPVTVTGPTPAATVTPGSATLVAPNGLTYVVSANADGTGASVVLGGGATATAYATCQTAGEDGNLAAGTVLQWSTTPANANATAAVAGAPEVDGAEVESDADYALRIIARRQERPGSGSRADWWDWATAVTGVKDAVVYPNLDATYGPNTRGATTVVLLGDAQGDSPTNTRIVSGTIVTRVEQYIEGEADANGTTSGTLRALRPASFRAGSYYIEAATAASQDAAVAVVNAGAYPFPFSTVYTVTAWNNTTKVLTLSTSPADVTAGDLVAVKDIGVRGGYRLGEVDAVNAGANQVTLTSAFSSTTIDTTGTGRMRPAPENWTSIRDAVFAYFDGLGPGDTAPPSRWPGEETRLRATLYRSALAADVIRGATGVLSASVTTPGSDVVPAAKAIVTLGTLVIGP